MNIKIIKYLTYKMGFVLIFCFCIIITSIVMKETNDCNLFQRLFTGASCTAWGVLIAANYIKTFGNLNN